MKYSGLILLGCLMLGAIVVSNFYLTKKITLANVINSCIPIVTIFISVGFSYLNSQVANIKQDEKWNDDIRREDLDTSIGTNNRAIDGLNVVGEDVRLIFNILGDKKSYSQQTVGYGFFKEFTDAKNSLSIDSKRKLGSEYLPFGGTAEQYKYYSNIWDSIKPNKDLQGRHEINEWFEHKVLSNKSIVNNVTNDFVNLPETIGMFSSILEHMSADFLYEVGIRVGRKRSKNGIVKKSDDYLLNEVLSDDNFEKQIVNIYFISLLLNELINRKIFKLNEDNLKLTKLKATE